MQHLLPDELIKLLIKIGCRIAQIRPSNEESEHCEEREAYQRTSFKPQTLANPGYWDLVLLPRKKLRCLKLAHMNPEESRPEATHLLSGTMVKKRLALHRHTEQRTATESLKPPAPPAPSGRFR